MALFAGVPAVGAPILSEPVSAPVDPSGQLESYRFERQEATLIGKLVVR
jgi:hypothetical protein